MALLSQLQDKHTSETNSVEKGNLPTMEYFSENASNLSLKGAGGPGELRAKSFGLREKRQLLGIHNPQPTTRNSKHTAAIAAVLA
ncbi:unnamed protein product [marine sediment metagenome]|uniref:Uncharacterized protein n=1 Tax=marine sediment metagenome TaxID=412755 RepID=X1C3Q6_9ZZZZ